MRDPASKKNVESGGGRRLTSTASFCMCVRNMHTLVNMCTLHTYSYTMTLHSMYFAVFFSHEVCFLFIRRIFVSNALRQRSFIFIFSRFNFSPFLDILMINNVSL